MATVGLPLTGAGDATAQVAVDLIGGEAFQRVKLFDATEGSTVAIVAKATTPGAADGGMVVRPIASTAFSQAVVGTVGLSSGSSAVELTSAGSTRLVGRFTLENPTTSLDLSSGGSTKVIGTVNATGTTKVDVSSGVILGAGSSANTLGAVAQGAGSTSVAPWYVISSAGGGSTSVDLASGGSTKVVGTVNATGTTKVDVSSGVILGAGSSANMLGQVFATGTTKVDVSSGVILGAGSSANMLGQVQATGTTKVDVSSGVILGAGSSANVLGSVTLAAGTSGNVIGSVTNAAGTSATLIGAVAVTSGVVLGAGSSANVIGSVTLAAGSSANVLGQVVQGPGSSANFWYNQSIPYSSANMARTTVNTTIDISVVAANANRKALVIANLSTAQIVALGLSTGAVTTGLTNANLFLPPNSQLSFGIGDLPLFQGPVRGINISSTLIAGGVAVMEFT